MTYIQLSNVVVYTKIILYISTSLLSRLYLLCTKNVVLHLMNKNLQHLIAQYKWLIDNFPIKLLGCFKDR